MFESIQGILKEKDPLKAIVETHGISYRLLIPLNTYTRLPATQTPICLFLSQVIREDAHSLYGFFSKEERDLFETLITLSGIGPKTALTLVGHMEITSFYRAIQAADTRILSKIPGIGKKTAERLVIEMRDKCRGTGKKGGNPSLSLGGEASLALDAVHALMNLGYHPTDAQKAIDDVLKKHKEETDLATLITMALKRF